MTLLDMCSSGDQDSMLYWYAWARADILDFLLGAWAIPYPNTAHFNDTEFDDLVLKAYASPTDEEYTYWFTKAHERLLDLAPWAPIMYFDQIHAIHTWVTGWSLHIMGQETVQNLLDVDIAK